MSPNHNHSHIIDGGLKMAEEIKKVIGQVKADEAPQNPAPAKPAPQPAPAQPAPEAPKQ